MRTRFFGRISPRDLRSAFFAWLLACGGIAVGQGLQPAPVQPVPLPPTSNVVVQPPAPSSSNNNSAINADVNARLIELEEIVNQQQTQVDSLQQQLKIATTPPPPEPSKPYVVGSALKMEAAWNNGVEFRSPKRDFYFHVGGRFQWDNIWLDSPNPTAALTNVGANNDAFQDASFFRRLRLRAEGSMYETVDWCVEFNFAQYFLAQDPTQSAPQINGGFQNNTGTNILTAQSRTFGAAAATDLWWNFREVPFFGNVQLGNEKEPFGLERLESSRYLDFLDRNMGNDAFISPSANGFAPGIMAWNWLPNKRGTYAYGYFKNVTNPFMFNVGDGQGEVAARMTGLPWYDEPTGGRYFAHVGIGAASRAIDNGIIIYRARGELRNGPDPLVPSWANTGPIQGHFQNIVNPEFMFQYGSLFVQSEFVANWTTDAVALTGTKGNVANNQHLGSLYFYNAYLQVMYFLTGEHRIYDYQKGLVGRVIPHSNAFWVRDQNGRIFGPGAWQIGARVDYLNFNNGGVQGGALTSMTVGLNWFINPNMKAQFNFDTTNRDASGASNSSTGAGTEGIIYGFGVRVAADF